MTAETADNTDNTAWYIFKGDRTKDSTKIEQLPDPPQWRDFQGRQQAQSAGGEGAMTQKERRGATFQASDEVLRMVNAALYLRRPLLVTGRPGTGKTSLAYAVAYELDLGEVLYWPITTRTTLKEGLYSYDAIGRMQDFQLSGKTQDRIGEYIRLGPLGTAFLPTPDQKPRVLLIDEIDKSDIDLPNDLLHIFEEGGFTIPELERLAESESQPSDHSPIYPSSHPSSHQNVVDVKTAYTDEAETSTYRQTVPITKGRVRCETFPFVIMTSNGEREFPPAFLRRCLRLDIKPPSEEELQQIVKAQLQWTKELSEETQQLIKDFCTLQEEGKFLSTDQLLNAVYMLVNEKATLADLKDKLFRALDQ